MQLEVREKIYSTFWMGNGQKTNFSFFEAKSLVF